MALTNFISKVLKSPVKVRIFEALKSIYPLFRFEPEYLKKIAEPIYGNLTNQELEKLVISLAASDSILSPLYKPLLQALIKYLYFVRGQFLFIKSLPKDFIENIPILKRLEQEFHLFEKAFDIAPKTLDYTCSGHILYINAATLLNTLNGYANRSHQIAKALTKEGVPITLLSFEEEKNDKVKERRIIEGVEYITYYVSAKGYQNGIISNSFKISRLIESEARRNRSSLIHAGSNYENALPGYIASKNIGIPFVYETRGLWHYTKATLQPEWQTSERFEMAEKMERIMIIKADIVFAISGQLRSFIAQEYSVNPEKIYLLKNSMPDYRAEIFENRENSEPFIIGYLGSLTAYEGLDRIVDALSLALKSGILFKVLIGGEGVYRRELEIQIKKLGLTDNLEFVGTVNRNEIEDFYRRIDLMVYPRRSSQLTELIPPMKVLEPACFQVLTLTSNLAPIVEICEGIPTIVTADLSTPEKILDNILMIKKNFNTLQGHFNSFDFSEHTWGIQAKNYIEVLNTALDIDMSSRPPLLPKKNILFVSHDLKFINFLLPLLEQFYNVSTSNWLGHNKPKDLNRERELTQNSDIIFCEWGLGNLVFRSREKKDNQVLITRIHAQEFRTNYLNRVKWDKVDHVILVSDVYMNEFLNISGMGPEKISIIPNYSNPNIQFSKRSAPFRKIGFVGAIPQNKRLDLALELIESLSSVSEDYELHILSKKPEELSWVANNRSEMKYFKKCLKDLDSLKTSGVKIFWHEFTDKPEEFYEKIDIVISVSDRESFHMTIADGMASGCFPAILEWPGARSIYDERFIRSNLTDLKDLIVSFSNEYTTNSVIEPLADEFKIDKVKQKFLSVLEP